MGFDSKLVWFGEVEAEVMSEVSDAFIQLVPHEFTSKLSMDGLMGGKRDTLLELVEP